MQKKCGAKYARKSMQKRKKSRFAYGGIKSLA